MVIRRIARPMLASVFVAGGADAFREPEGRARVAEPVIEGAVDAAEAADLPVPPWEDETYVRVNGAVQVGAGLLLAVGRLPRLASAALAATLVPTTLGGHRFWEHDGAERAAQRTQFLKNLALTGGLILAAVDLEGRPGVRSRAERATRDADHAAQLAAAEARAVAAETKAKAALGRAHLAERATKETLSGATSALGAAASTAASAAGSALGTARDAVGR